jgi:hypothetical protein
MMRTDRLMSYNTEHHADTASDLGTGQRARGCCPRYVNEPTCASDMITYLPSGASDPARTKFQRMKLSAHGYAHGITAHGTARNRARTGLRVRIASHG